MAATNKQCVVIYDGNCEFCRAQVASIQRLDRKKEFEYVPFQVALERFPELGDCNLGMRLIDSDGKVYIGADGVYQIVCRLPRWRRIAWLYRLPGLRWFLRMIYAWIVTHRRSRNIECATGVCQSSRGTH
jgi:predicted DCC family thiol-disulfide oxidoreductase YuxK